MAKSLNDLITMLRNVTGRIDDSDPQFTNQIMGQYLTDFIQLDSTQDVRLFQQATWWEFTIDENSDNPYPVNLQTIELTSGAVGASTIGGPAYADGFIMDWYQDPALFYGYWPETQEYTPTRPTAVLYYNNTLTFRNPPNQEYLIKIQAYEVAVGFVDGTMTHDYMYRYYVYGAALNIFSDYGEMDRWNETFRAFTRFRALVYGRTNLQYQQQRPLPQF